MKNDVSHEGILLNLIFAQFCQIFLGKTGFRIQKFICVKTYLGQGEYYLKFSAKSVKYYPTQIRNFFSLKPSRDQDRDNKKKFSQIGPAVLEDIGCKQASKQTNKHRVAI